MKAQEKSRLQHPNCLVLFTRYPVPGETKTRLIPAIGAEGAAELQKKLTERIVTEYEKLARQIDVSLLLHFSGASLSQMEAWLGDHVYTQQPKGDLGVRMAQGFFNAKQLGAENVLLVGSDIPKLSSEILAEAFRMLERGDVVMGPSSDGGFYAIGMKAKHIDQLLPDLFNDVIWSTPTVLATLVEQLKARGFFPAMLPTLDDIDTPEDLAKIDLNSF